MVLTRDDLYTRVYDLETLKANIYAVSLLDILKTQKLTADFCVKYILNSDFQIVEEDEIITMELVKQLQPHILKVDFVVAQVKAAKKKLSRQRIDSFDFSTFSTFEKS
jgi:hypothetical protein